MSMHFNVEFLVSMFWPFAFVAVAWAVSVWALSQPDPQTELVRRLTGAAMRPADRPTPQPEGAVTPKSSQPREDRKQNE